VQLPKYVLNKFVKGEKPVGCLIMGDLLAKERTVTIGFHRNVPDKNGDIPVRIKFHIHVYHSSKKTFVTII